MKSMTGFGKADVQTSSFALDVTVRSVNGRFLEVKIHAPKIYSPLEIEIRKRVAKTMKRGTVEIYINRKAFSGAESVSFNPKLAKKWLSGFNEVAEKLKLEPVSDSRVLLNIPEFVKVEEVSTLSTKEKAVLFKTLDQSVKLCSTVKSHEGEGLKKDLASHLKALEKQLTQVKKLRDRTLKDLSKKYRTRLDKLGVTGEVDEQRLAQEIVIQVDKSDISEEIQRLQAHLKAVGELITQKGSIGKKLDFYAQELLREINTIGSKSTSSELTQVIVESKGLVEKYREQVQNVE